VRGESGVRAAAEAKKRGSLPRANQIPEKIRYGNNERKNMIYLSK
jgi:hypothetical protein